VSLLERVAGRLHERGTPFALIGAAAMAVHGVSRSTRDIDVLVVDTTCLDATYWDPLRGHDVDITIRRGDADDPFVGVVRLRDVHDAVIDVVVGSLGWQRRTVAAATIAVFDGVRLSVVRRSDLVLMKLYAGGPQDAWDIEQLLDSPDRPALVAAVDGAVSELPADSQRLWQRIQGSAG
jgi:predicted nucleotidyltransferase